TTETGSPVAFLAHDPPTLERAREISPVLREELGAAPLILSTLPHVRGPGEVALPEVPPEAAPLLLAHASAQLVRTVARSWGVNTDRFRAGRDEERYVRGSTRAVRESRILT
ncbi:MAG: hypothetical protein HY900_14595, partial [Deltaproteobacteria bacterium]|nr:hypothetical protein [Deltaproteobacteria bacterium]